MHKPIIDAHVHFDMYREQERKQILEAMEAYKITDILSVSRHLSSAQHNLEIAESDSRIKVAIGFHPEQAIPSDTEVDQLLSLIDRNQHNVVAIGEVGLPYYLRKEDEQIKLNPYLELLEVFIQKAKGLDLPIALHAIYEDAPMVCDLLEKYSLSNAHFHWFKGDAKTVERLIENGYYISITPDVLYEKEIQELVKTYPISQMMVETDGPWPFEGPFQGHMTHPKMVHESIAKIADIKQCHTSDVYTKLYQNTRDFYFNN